MIFYKLHGAGNDFIFFVNQKPQPRKVAQICDRHTGIGADGVVWLKRLGKNKYKWDFFNSDGSAAEMCGNAARCAMRLIQREFSEQTMALKTRAGLVLGSVVSKQIAVSFDISSAPIKEITNPAGTEFKRGYYLISGVPHCVIPTQKPFVLRERTQKLAPYIKNKVFGVKGSNLTFVNFKTRPLQAVTLERGVEDFTLACGTGVIAAARVYQQIADTNKPVKIKTPGGDFTVKFNGSTATLIGAAEIIYKGETWNRSF